MTLGESSKFRPADVPYEELAKRVRERFWARALASSAVPKTGAEFDILHDQVNTLMLADVIREACSASFESCVASDGFVTERWSSYRLAAAIACALVTRRDDYIPSEPTCGNALAQYLGDFALPDQDLGDDAPPEGEQPNTYVRVCAMDAADATIRLINDGAIEIGTAPLYVIASRASRIADALHEMEGDKESNLVDLIEKLMPEIEGLGNAVRGVESSGREDESAPGPEPAPRTRTPHRVVASGIALVVGLFVGVPIGAFGQSAIAKDQDADTATLTTQAPDVPPPTTIKDDEGATTAIPPAEPSDMTPPPATPASAGPVVPKVLARSLPRRWPTITRSRQFPGGRSLHPWPLICTPTTDFASKSPSASKFLSLPMRPCISPRQNPAVLTSPTTRPW